MADLTEDAERDIPEPRDHAYFMRLAIEAGAERDDLDNTPTGSVVVFKGSVVSTGYNDVPTTGDPTAHAEIVAIRKATAALGKPGLDGATLYTTAEPCPMCCGAILVAGVTTLVLGSRTKETDADPWPNRWRWGDCRTENLLALTGWNSRLQFITGVLEEECDAVRNRWRLRTRST